MNSSKKNEAREKRKKRMRRKVKGSSERPRLTVFKSDKHIYAQIIDDASAKTLVNASSLGKEIKNEFLKKGGNKEGASILGKIIAKKALEQGIKKVIFDRNGFLYHGRVKALAEAARENGLEF
ncbi:MAG: 50S ribosomal protein L18 [Desulfobacteraceae bacterium]|nr:MAG: 50S ribosomal protein L18 [Desulfobacteraceae bacterium]